MWSIIAAILVTLLVTPLAVLLILFNRKRLYIIKRALAASDGQIEAIYSSVDGAVAYPASAVLGRTNRVASGDDWLIPVPRWIKPWGGRAISVEQEDEVAFIFVQSGSLEPTLLGRVYRTVASLPITEDDEQNVATLLVRFVDEHSSLKTALVAVCPEYPAQLLQYLLCPGVESFELDSVNQIQLGGNPAWVQDEEFPICRHCQRQLILILQIPGTLLPVRSVPRGTYFFFGCPEHAEENTTIAQFT
jgi:hypothetical protein